MINNFLLLIIACSASINYLKPAAPKEDTQINDWDRIENESNPNLAECVSAILADEAQQSHWSALTTGANVALNWLKENYNPQFTLNVMYAKLPIGAKHERVLLYAITEQNFKEFAEHLTHDRTTRWLDRALTSAMLGMREQSVRLLLQAAHDNNLLNNLPKKTRENAATFLSENTEAKRHLMTERITAYTIDIQLVANLITLTNPHVAKPLDQTPTHKTLQEKAEHVVQKLTEIASCKTLPPQKASH